MPDPYRIILSPQVAAQLEGILDHIAADSPHNAAAFIAQLLSAIEGLQTLPHRQIVRDQPPSTNAVRSLPVGNYIVFFKVLDAHHVVRILRVAHGARRLPKRFE